MLLIIVGLVGYIIYDKIIQDSNSNVPTIDNNSSNGNDAFETFRSNIKNNMKNNNNYNISLFGEFTPNSSNKKIQYRVSLNSKNELRISYYSGSTSQYNDYKLADDVLGFNIVSTGQGGLKTLYFINYDGSVSAIETEYTFLNDQNLNNKLEIRNNVGNLKNIVSIISGSTNDVSGANIPLFIDIYGNIHIL